SVFSLSVIISIDLSIGMFVYVFVISYDVNVVFSFILIWFNFYINSIEFIILCLLLNMFRFCHFVCWWFFEVYL
ncbi:MAG: hypothetical protein ACEY3A_05140, partial [Wolbachia sp.]